MNLRQRPAMYSLGMIALTLGVAGCAATRSDSECPCGGACMVDPPSATAPGAVLSQPERDALVAALLDEQRAQAFYQSVMDRHGRVRPFANIIQAEQNHEQAVRTVMSRYGVAVPPAQPPDVPAPAATLRESARLAARLERENIALYDRLIPTCSQTDVRNLFERLRAASYNNHLPAFERWAGT